MMYLIQTELFNKYLVAMKKKHKPNKFSFSNVDRSIKAIIYPVWTSKSRRVVSRGSRAWVSTKKKHMIQCKFFNKALWLWLPIVLWIRIHLRVQMRNRFKLCHKVPYKGCLLTLLKTLFQTIFRILITKWKRIYSKLWSSNQL